jgi:hypothetical protein
MKRVIGVLLIIVLAYAAYPYIALYRLGDAIRGGDAGDVEGKVDWPSLRQGLKDDLNTHFAAKAGADSDDTMAALGTVIAGKMISSVVDSTVTPSGLSVIMQTGRAGPTIVHDIAPAVPEMQKDRPLPRVASSGFHGLGAFEAEIAPREGDGNGKLLKVRLELEGGYWMLTHVYLPM